MSLTPLLEKRLAEYESVCSRLGYLPSVIEIGEAWGLSSTASAHYNLELLRRAGHPVPTRGRDKTDALTPESWAFVRDLDTRLRSLNSKRGYDLLTALRKTLEGFV